MIEEDAMHRFSNFFAASERKRKVGNSAAHATPVAKFFDFSGRVDEGDAVVVMLLHASGDGQDVGIENDIVGIETDFVHQ